MRRWSLGVPCGVHRAHPHSEVLALAAALVLAACSSEPVGSPKADLVAGPNAPVKMLDPDINTGDSYFQTEVALDIATTIDSSEAFPDPATGAYVTSWSYSAPTATFYVEGGYDYYGRTRVNTQVLSDPDNDLSPDHRITYMQMVNDAGYDYMATGSALAASLRTDAPMASLGSLVDVNFGIAGGDPGGGGGGGDDCGMRIDCGQDPMIRSGQDPMIRSVTPTGQLRLTSTFVLDRHLARLGGVAAAKSDEQKATKVKHDRRYEKEGKLWVLREENTDIDEPLESGVLRTRKRMRFTKTKYFVNEDKNKERDARRKARPPTLSPISAQPTSIIMPPPDDSDTGGSSGGTGGTTSCTVGTQTSSFAGTQNIILQHGIFSDNCTWKLMKPWLNRDFSLRNVLETALPSTAHYADQANMLRSAMDTRLPSNRGFVVIAHSQGGIISRRAATDDPQGRIAGVLTIGTPHGGAPIGRAATIASVAATTAKLVGKVVGAGYGIPIDWNRFYANLKEFGQCTIIGAACDARPGSAFLDDLNGRTEGFRRAAVVNKAKRTWLLYRLLGDFTCGGVQLNNDNCGRGAVRKAESVEKGLKKCAVVGSVLSIFTGGITAAAAAVCVTNIAILRGADYGWRLLVSSDALSDGFIPAWSQQYPNVPIEQQFYIEDADSHVGETRSADKVYPRVNSALVNVFTVTRR